MASKKNLIILLIMPFAISLLSVSAISMTFNLIDNDIVDISWDYEDNEVFALSGEKTRHPLKARAINDRNYPTGQTLVWNVYNTDGVEEPHAEIYINGNNAYLHTLSVGEVAITVANDKGNVQKKMNATIFNKNTIAFNTAVKGSQSNVSSKLYYGQYDIKNNTKVLSSIEFDVSAITENNNSGVKVIDNSDNVSVDLAKKVINFSHGGTQKVVPSYVTFGFTNPDILETYTFNFNIVTNGYNVYNYNDLLWCTNKSDLGEIVVMRTNLESSANITSSNSSNTALFGNKSGDGYNFAKEVKTIQTNFNREYIKQWNDFARKSKGVYKTVSDDIKVGLKVQKDFYGNGFTINMHNLTYPYSQIQTTDQNNQTQIVPKLTDANLFRGPLPYYTLGDPNKMPIVTAYGQDNIGMYVVGNNITIDDLVLKSCDFGNNLANLDTVGTTMEVYGGENITIKNCRLSNGKTVFKSYDSKNVELDNCLLSYSRNFLVMSGSYEYLTLTGNDAYNFTYENGVKQLNTLNNYLAPKAPGDTAVNNYMYGKNEGGHNLEAMMSIQNALDAKRPSSQSIYGTLNINDTLFYRSGISSIGLESLFNGPFLFNASPSVITDALGRYSGQMEEFGIGIPYIPTKVGGVSYPVNVNISGKTKFYDYKAKNILDINGLVGENISDLASAGGYEQEITLDTIFPIKTILLEEAAKNGRNAIYKGEVNSPFAFYGGGLNLSTITYSDDFEDKAYLTDTFDVNFLERYSQIGNMGEGLMANIFGAVLKAVTVVSGFNPFRFTLMKNGHLYGETPQVQTLIDNAK